MNVVLASASPRRRELLALLVKDFTCEPTHIDETERPGESPESYVHRLAREKAAASPQSDALVIAADTTVAIQNTILGKPADRADAERILLSLSGRSHEVHTAIAVRFGARVESRLVSTLVTFAAISRSLLNQYLMTEEPWDKAGAYGIQGLAGSFVTRIDGSYSAVVGLPLAETRELLSGFGLTPQWV